MARWGRWRFDPHSTGPAEFGTLEYDLWQLAQADPDGFIDAIADAVLPQGGWALYGAANMTISVLGSRPTNARFDELLGASLDFLQAQGVQPSQLNGYEREFLAERSRSTT